MYKLDLTGKRISFITLGCKVNSYESDSIAGRFEELGATIVPFGSDADVIVVNTCSVTNMGDRKSRQMLHRAREKFPHALIVGTGCYVQLCADELIKNGTLDLAFGNNRKSVIADSVAAALSGEAYEPCQVSDISKEHSYEPMEITKSIEHSRAFIKVQDGCDQFCSYCIIPYARGRIRSRSIESVVNEVEGLARKGYTEVVLTGIHLSSYGLENYEDGAKKKEAGFFDHAPLLKLIEAVSKVSGIYRIRLGSLEPRIISESFAKALSNNPKFCPQFHLSLQNGSDSVLKKMNRHYSASEYRERVDILKKYFDRPAITTDVIAGFPGESEDAFEESCDFLRSTGFAKIHVFPYSRRKGTVADKMPEQVPDEIKKKRAEKVSAIETAMRMEYRKSFIGEESTLLIERLVSINGKEYFTGYNTRYIGIAVLKEELLAAYGKPEDICAEETFRNRIVAVRLTGVLDEEHLTGAVVKKCFVAMSGGVDSSVTLKLVKDMGYECMGLTMVTDSLHRMDEDIEAASLCCRSLGVGHLVADVSEVFKEKVIDSFIMEYEKGNTPNPCVVCNRYLKFGLLYEYAALNGAKLATGHYALIEERDGRKILKRAKDTVKDQSYMLYSLTSDKLDNVLFPLGSYTKDEVRDIALKEGFNNAHKSDSQDICFIPDGDYAGFIAQRTGKEYPKGSFVDMNGRILGEHKGLINYTIGQRKGLGLSLPEPLYVKEKQIDGNRVLLCSDKELFSDRLFADDFLVIDKESPEAADLFSSEGLSCEAKVRYAHKGTMAKAYAKGTGTFTLEVIFDEPVRAITKGQSVVLYSDNMVVGGGIISS